MRMYLVSVSIGTSAVLTLGVWLPPCAKLSSIQCLVFSSANFYSLILGARVLRGVSRFLILMIWSGKLGIRSQVGLTDYSLSEES